MNKHDLLALIEGVYGENEVLEIDHAINVATDAHKGQKRKSGEPYITHPLSVAASLIDWGMDADSIIAGIFPL